MKFQTNFLCIAVVTITMQIPSAARSALPHLDRPARADTIRVDFNEDGYDDYVTTEAATGHLRWFAADEGGWRELSEVEAVDPWRVSSPEPRAEILRGLVSQGDVPLLFAVTFGGRLRVIDTRTGMSAMLRSISYFQNRLFPNAMSSSPDSGLVVFSRYHYDGHLYDFRPVSASLVTDHPLALPQMLNVRGLATIDEDNCYAARSVLTPSPDVGNELWILHPVSGTASLVGSMGNRFRQTQSLALAPDGVLYGWSISLGQLMRIDTATGVATPVGQPWGPRPDIQGMAFAPDGTLFGGRQDLYRIDPETGMTELVGPTTHRSNFMYIESDIRGLAFAKARLKEINFLLRGGDIPAELPEWPRGIIQGFITGAEDLDVLRIDTKSIRIAGDLPVMHCRIADVVAPPGRPGDHSQTGPDGFPDLIFSFDSTILFDLLWPMPIGEVSGLGIFARTVDEILLFGTAAIDVPNGDRSFQAKAVNDDGNEMSAFPNPFNPQTVLSFSLAGPDNVSLIIYDHRGCLVRTLASGLLSAGSHRVTWDGKDDRGAAVSSGAYRVLLRTSGRPQSIAVLLLR